MMNNQRPVVVADPSAAALIARLTDTEPPVEVETPALRQICAWCPTFNPTLASNKGATHGICPSCFAKVQRGSPEGGLTCTS